MAKGQLSRVQADVLIQTAREDGQSSREIGEDILGGRSDEPLGYDGGHAHLRRLEDRGLVTRIIQGKPGPGNHATWKITARGRKLLEQCGYEVPDQKPAAKPRRKKAAA